MARPQDRWLLLLISFPLSISYVQHCADEDHHRALAANSFGHDAIQAALSVARSHANKRLCRT